MGKRGLTVLAMPPKCAVMSVANKATPTTRIADIRNKREYTETNDYKRRNEHDKPFSY